MTRHLMLCTTALVICGILGLMVGKVLAEDKTVNYQKEWKGGTNEAKDNDAWRHAPDDNVIADPKAWAKLWKAWRFDKELPKVDFEKELILVVASEGPNPIRNDKLTLNATGNLQFDWSHTDKLGPGYRYLILRVSRDGVKTVNGTAIPKE